MQIEQINFQAIDHYIPWIKNETSIFWQKIDEMIDFSKKFSLGLHFITNQLKYKKTDFYFAINPEEKILDYATHRGDYIQEFCFYKNKLFLFGYSNFKNNQFPILGFDKNRFSANGWGVRGCIPHEYDLF